jgi:hypothetical protein
MMNYGRANLKQPCTGAKGQLLATVCSDSFAWLRSVDVTVRDNQLFSNCLEERVAASIKTE